LLSCLLLAVSFAACLLALLCLQEVGNVAAFLVSPLASAITGHCCYVDNGLNIMGLAMDSKTLDREASA
jgi:enoyl-[acyl-carrier-protein] reductase (NADH)